MRSPFKASCIITAGAARVSSASKLGKMKAGSHNRFPSNVPRWIWSRRCRVSNGTSAEFKRLMALRMREVVFNYLFSSSLPLELSVFSTVFPVLFIRLWLWAMALADFTFRKIKNAWQAKSSPQAHGLAWDTQGTIWESVRTWKIRRIAGL